MRAFVNGLEKGHKVQITWRFAAHIDEPETETAVWTGVVESVDTDPDGAKRAFINYDSGLVGLPGGGCIQFPPPTAPGQMIDVFAAKATKPARAFPDMSMFTRPVTTPALPEPRAELSPNDRKSRRDETADDIADALRGEQKKVRIVDGLKVPLEIASRFNAFYPQLWLGKDPHLWSLRMSACLVELGVQWSIASKRDEFFNERDAFISYLMAASIPEDKVGWLLPFNMAFRMFALCAGGRSGAGEEARVAADCHRSFADGFVNLATAWPKNETRGPSRFQFKERKTSVPQQKGQPRHNSQRFRPSRPQH